VRGERKLSGGYCGLDHNPCPHRDDKPAVNLGVSPESG
jgi:hypothetical protein